ncbi:MAG: SO_0444 family Cu/Zn efflux transporter [Desulfobulbaceae bacterium]|nr:SO_0444 family Cu/Zn efflux transporter [Desulfobulbaceae bacterium]
MNTILTFLHLWFVSSWEFLLESAPYIIIGLVLGGLLKMFLSTDYVAQHLGRGRFSSVLKAALFGIPLPLCSCGVLPAAAALKRQGANNGATTAFLISTPESGFDSIAISYALLDPIMTVARPLAAFLSALVAGSLENFFNPPRPQLTMFSAIACPVDNCCDGRNCHPDLHRRHHGVIEKMVAGLRYAVFDIWADLAGWFLLGALLAGLITSLVPETVMTSYLGGGVTAMLLMLLFGIPLYICATSSTPIAAALIMKGVSPGAALVFLLVGPATNISSITVLNGLLGKRATALYLASIAGVSVLCGLLVDWLYWTLGIKAQAVVGQAAEIMPVWLQGASVMVLLLFSIQPLSRLMRKKTGVNQVKG